MEGQRPGTRSAATSAAGPVGFHLVNERPQPRRLFPPDDPVGQFAQLDQMLLGSERLHRRALGLLLENVLRRAILVMDGHIGHEVTVLLVEFRAYLDLHLLHEVAYFKAGSKVDPAFQHRLMRSEAVSVAESRKRHLRGQGAYPTMLLTIVCI